MTDQVITLYPGDTVTINAPAVQPADAPADAPTDPAATPDATPAEPGVQPADPAPQGVG